MSRRNDLPMAVLWRLRMNDSQIMCRVYRDGDGLRLCVESQSAVIVQEPFAMEPRAVARARTLRDILKRQGWRDVPDDGPTEVTPTSTRSG